MTITHPVVTLSKPWIHGKCKYMCLCMCVCRYVDMYYVHTYVCVSMRVFMYVHMYTSMCVCMYVVYMRVCMFIYLFSYACGLCVYSVQSDQCVPVYVSEKYDELYLMWEIPNMKQVNGLTSSYHVDPNTPPLPINALSASCVAN